MTYHHREAVGFVWAIADLLRGTYKAHDYGDVRLPLVVLRRLDQALADTKQAVLERNARLEQQGIENREPVLRSVSKRSFLRPREHPPEARQLAGYRGIYLVADRQTGKSLSITLWDSEEDLRASEAEADRLRQESADHVGDTIAGVERYEVILQELT